MADRVVLVTGSTGNQGGAVARRLLETGWPVRALTRSPDGERARQLRELGAEVVGGDLDDAESVARAVAGAYGVFSVQNFWEHGAEAEVRQGTTLADAAHRAGVEHFVYSSVGGTDRGVGLSHFGSKGQIEEHLRTLGLPATIVRPVFLMENFNGPQYRPAILGGTLAFGIQPGRTLQLVACADVAHYTERALANRDEFVGEAVELAGDERTADEHAVAFTQVIGRPVRYVPVPLERVRAMKAEVGEMFAWMNEEGYQADVEALRRRFPELLTFEEWLRRTGWEGADAEAAGRPGQASPAGR